MKKRILFVTLVVALLAFVFVLSTSAAEYTVGETGCDYTSIANATSNAQDGDTIIIKTDISGGTITWDKSLTYILEANWTNVSGNNASANTAGKTISVYARGGDRTIAFKGDNLFNSYGTSTDGVTINFGGEDGYLLKMDVSGVTKRFLYDFSGATVNFYEGVRFFGGSFTAGEPIINCKVFNMYDNAEIYGNIEWSNNAVGGLIITTDANIYGGEIYGNVMRGGYAMIRCMGNFNMYGGEIYNNYNLYASQGGDHGPGLINALTQNIYGGTIHDNYQAKGASTYGGTVFGSRLYTSTSDYSTPCHAYLIDGSVYDNYCFTTVTAIKESNFSTYFSTETNGAYKIKDTSFLTVVTFQRTSKKNETLFDHSIIIKTADGRLTDAFMINADGTIVKASSGATEFSVPTTAEYWGASATSCIGAIPSAELTVENSGVFYPTAHAFAQKSAIIYTNGFAECGKEYIPCTAASCTYEQILADDLAPIVTTLGYSVKEDVSRGYGISGGYKINHSAIDAYESANGVTLEVGVIMLNPEYATADTFFTSGVLTIPSKAIQVTSNVEYGVLNFMINSFNSTMLDLDLIISSYISEISEASGTKSYKTSFIQDAPVSTDEAYTFKKDDATLYSVSCNLLNK